MSCKFRIYYRLIEELSASEKHYREVLEHLREIVFQCDSQGILTFLNQSWEITLGYSLRESLGTSFYQFVVVADHDRLVTAITTATDGHQAIQELCLQQADGQQRWFELALHGDRSGIITGSLYDMTERKYAEDERHRAENERAQLQEQIIILQRTTLAQLSTPLIPISDSVVVLPLIGWIDSRRQEIMETLLHGVSNTDVHFAIIDITGVAAVDSQVANLLLQATQAVRLLGVQVMLTGIRPEDRPNHGWVRY